MDRYYSFVYRDVLFLVLDTEDYPDQRRAEIAQARSAAIAVEDAGQPEKARQMEYFRMPERVTGQVGPDQAAYFIDVIEASPEVRWTFLLMHKPVWRREDRSAFTGIEEALSNRPDTVFNGHFHSYSHTERHGRDYIMLGTTGGSQNPDRPMSFDHVTLVTITDDGPSIANLRLEGILDKTGHVPMRAGE